MADEVHEANGSSRGEFLARGAGIAGLAVGAGVWASGLAKAPAAAAAGDTRSYVSGYFALDLGGTTGMLKRFDGGEITGEVVDVPTGDGNLSKKHIGNVKYDDFSVQCGLTMSKPIYDWIDATWAGKGERRSGAIKVADRNMNAKVSHEFTDALISEVKIPACDASSKEAGYLTVKFAPEKTTNKGASGKLSSSITKGQKQWLPANFRLKLGDLPCSRVSKIDSFTVKQAIVTEPVGGSRFYNKEPGKLEFPNLKVTFSEADIKPWNTWFEQFVLRGDSGDVNEKSGSITFLGPSLKDALAVIELFNVGIYRLYYDNALADGNAIKRVTAELYVERMEFHLK